MTKVTVEALTQAIFGQESSHGKADTSQKNYAGARGPMQVTEATFDALKNKGIIPKDFKHDNPQHSQEAGNSLVRHLYNKYAGDAGKVAAAYYAGEKAVRADGTIADFRDRKNPKAPTTLQYREAVLKRLGVETAALAPAQVAAAVPAVSTWDSTAQDRHAVPSAVAGLTPPGPSTWDDTMKDRHAVPQASAAGKGGLKPVVDERLSADGVRPLASQLADSTAVLRAAAEKRDSTSFLGMSRDAFIQNTFVGSALRNYTINQFIKDQAPAPGYTLDPKALSEMTEAEQEFMRQANSPAAEERIRLEIEDNRERSANINAKGTGMGIAATIFAGLPEGYLTGMGAMRAASLSRVSATQLAARGSTGAAIASSAVENIGANLALTAVQGAFDPYVGKSDYAMAVAGGILGVGLTAPSLFGAVDKATLTASAQRMMDSAAAETIAVREQALRNLGPDATPENLIAEARRLEANKVREDLGTATARPNEAEKVFPDTPELRSDAPASADKGVLDTPAQEAAPKTEVRFASENPRWDLQNPSATRDAYARNNPEFIRSIGEIEGASMIKADALPAGVHVQPLAAGSIKLGPAVRAVQELAGKFLDKDTKLVLGISKISDSTAGAKDPNYNGVAISVGRTHFIGLNESAQPTAALTTAIHEVGHVVFHSTVKDIPPPLLQKLVAEHREFLAEFRAGKKEARYKRFSEGSSNINNPDGSVRGELPLDGKLGEYVASFDEYTAEAFVRFVQKRARSDSPLITDKGAMALLRSAWEKIRALWEDAKERGFLAKDSAFDEYFQRVLDSNLAGDAKITAKHEEFLAADLIANFDRPVDVAQELRGADAARHGLNFLPAETPGEKATAAAILNLYKKATTSGIKVDETRLSKLMETSVFQRGQSIANTMLRSDNPVMRWVSATLLESPSGAAGRRATAAVSKHMHEKAMMGNTLNDVQGAYELYRNSQGGHITGDFFDGKHWEQFNRLLTTEIESRRVGGVKVESPPAVRAAADALEGAYERIRTAQVNAKTLGWASLPETSTGYMPHRLSPQKLVNMTPKQEEVLHKSLVTQFVGRAGFDEKFSETLASRYMDRVRTRAFGGFDSPINVSQGGAADAVREALEGMGLGQAEVDSLMARYSKGAAGHTKERLDLDISEEIDLGNGEKFRLMDLFDTDHFQLLRGQARRVSGEVALAEYGVVGKPGLALLRKAMEFGGAGERTTAREMEAFDQAAAEMLGEPFGTQNKLVDRLLQANALSRLGGMGFTQMAEGINGIFHVGVLRTMSAMGSMGRLRSEIKALARGEAVNNPVLGSIERFGGAEFGTDRYKTVFPFDNPSLEYQTYGKDTITAADRLLRGGMHLQGKLSFWRTLHATQSRGMAEQIVRKAADYLKSGQNDAALRDMGISDDLLDRLRKDLGNIAEFEGGKLTNFDISKATDAKAAKEFVQAIHRGTSQIIQETFVGERSAWAHDGMMRLLTQFRTFGLTSIEKQWGRQVGNVGTAKALGMLLGSMSLAAPVYMARVYLSSVGRSDQEEYLERRLSTQAIARSTLNYVAMAGLSGDFLDATTAVTGLGEITGGRAGNQSSFVGGVVAPAAGLANDLWKGIQNTKEGTDPHELIRAMPFSKLPFMIPAINALGD